MKKMNKVAYLVALATTATLAPVATSHAAGTITFGEDQYVSVGFGMRGSYSNLEDAANDGGNSNDFELDSARLYVSGSLNKYIKTYQRPPRYSLPSSPPPVMVRWGTERVMATLSPRHQAMQPNECCHHRTGRGRADDAWWPGRTLTL